jgi:transposase
MQAIKDLDPEKPIFPLGVTDSALLQFPGEPRMSVDVNLNLARKLNWLEVARHFQLDWKTVGQIVQSVDAEGLKRRPWQQLRIIGVDEVSRKRGHCYLTLVYDLERRRLIWLGEDGSKETLDSFFSWLNRKRCHSIMEL